MSEKMTVLWILRKKLALYNLMIINNFQDIMSVVGCLIAYEHQQLQK